MNRGTNKYLPWAGHPSGLPTLFLMEMWERFSYYGMKAILVLFLMDQTRGGWGLSEDNAYATAAVYSALVYLTPLFGGFIADRWLGARKATFLGGLVIAAGHFSLAMQTVFSFKLGLAFLIIGNGLFKPNVSAMVGGLYAADDQRKDGGYSIFYSGINWGALLGIFICGYLGEKISWHLGFGVAGVAMLLGLLVFGFRQRTLGTAGLRKGKSTFSSEDMTHVFKLAALCLAVGVACILALPLLRVLYDPMAAITGKESDKVAILFFWRLPLALVLVSVLHLVFKDRTEVVEDASTGAKRYGLIVMMATIAFFAVAVGLGQTDGILTVFADKRIDLNMMGWQFPASWVQNLNPIFVVLLAPLFARMWEKLPLHGITKQGMGLLILAGSFWLVGLAKGHSDSLLQAAGMAEGAPGAPRISILWLFGPYFLLTLGELCISPIGLALVQKCSPQRLVSLMFAIYFLGSFAANSIANPMKKSFEAHGLNMWTSLAAVSLVMGILWILLTPVVRRWTEHEETEVRSF